LLHRKYLELIEPKAAGQFSVRLGSEGTSGYFPLAEHDEARATAKANQLQRVLAVEGWGALCRRFPREFALALFWNQNPLLITYTTLITSIAPLPPANPARKPAAGIRVAVIEGDESVRRAMELWANRLPGWTWAGGYPSADPATLKSLQDSADLILFNRSQNDLQPAPPSGTGDPRDLPVPTFSFGIYETSDDIFIAHSGVSSGYFLRRTHPQHVLDPIRTAWGGDAPDAAQLRSRIDHYFQALITDSGSADRTPARTTLTSREQEILLRLSKGYPDKQIAGDLNISSWTVHNHMKNIFRKLGVHTRTQAVLKHLQR
jgi:DNA-binding CsgD family transcriptional regulator